MSSKRYTEGFKIEGLVEAREVTGLELKGVNRPGSCMRKESLLPETE